MQKKYIILAVIPFLLSSCNINNNEGNSHNPYEDTCIIKENTTIDFFTMLYGDYYDEMQKIVAKFEETEPHVKVNFSNPLGNGKYEMLEKTVISGFFKGEYPDIVQCYADNVVKYLHHGYAMNLDSFMNNAQYGISQEQSDYVSAFMEEGANYTVNGTYSLPFCKSTELMYYNADVLLGLDLSNIDASINNGKKLDVSYFDSLTWEELFGKLCPALKAYDDTKSADEKLLKHQADNPSSYVTYDSDQNLFITLAYQYGYGYTSVNEQGEGQIDFNNDGMKNLMKTFNAARKNGYLETNATINDYVSGMFTKQRCLFTISSTASISYNYNEANPFKVGVAKIPSAQDKEYCSINQGPSLCILDHHNNNRSLASYLLWKYITNEKNASDWALYTGYMGIRNSCYTNSDYQKATTINDDSSLKSILAADNLKAISNVRTKMFNTPVFRGSSDARANAGKLMKDCLINENIDTEIDALFDSYYQLTVDSLTED